MNKYSQRELMNEGLWNSVKSGVKKTYDTGVGAAKQIYTVGKEVAKTVAPEITDPISKVRDWAVNTDQKRKESKIPFSKKLRNWISEQGKWALKEPRKTGTYADGTAHWAVNIAEKGINQKTGQETIGRVYRDPNAIVGYDPVKREFKWVVKPRSDSYKTEPDPADPRGKRKRFYYHDEAARPSDEDYYDSYNQPFPRRRS